MSLTSRQRSADGSSRSRSPRTQRSRRATSCSRSTRCRINWESSRHGRISNSRRRHSKRSAARISTQRSAASIAADQTRRAKTNLDRGAAHRRAATTARSEGLCADPATRPGPNRGARRRNVARSRHRYRKPPRCEAINTDAAAEATVRARKAALAIAERALRRHHGAGATRRPRLGPDSFDRRNGRTVPAALCAGEHREVVRDGELQGDRPRANRRSTIARPFFR